MDEIDSRAESAVDIRAARAAAKTTTTSQYPRVELFMIRAQSRARTWSLSIRANSGSTTTPTRPQTRAIRVVVKGIKAISASERFSTCRERLA